ncbi:DUF5686 and carboxypeptidase regulatory-like domain-containing protein [Dokdonia sp. Hel_I_53]|uniref:DUF5686 and carboxypeptidase regulatory-like domain-containing protein n=1 Tax=Dokdonia sp. Hel_I_53 TaxID=1566287 RepID=UPI001198D773|nr:DUF5686 and carboxypeptidase regulatory-like domain-containing protein [Dokdonia sp. Hel_I_53]TVZ50937.1 carboxypeptidase-like protein [Dokdonia sp. Hel_I_53]
MGSKKNILFLFIVLITFKALSQITGVVTDTNGNTLPFVNVFVEDTNRGTATNGDGFYELTILPQDIGNSITLVYQFLGYKTKRATVTISEQVFQKNIILAEEATSLDEVIVQAGVNPADRIIKATIARREENLARLSEYTAKFYSRGLWKVKDAPEKILGRVVGDLGGGLDSTRTGIIYLSETVSNIAYRRPNDFSETIIASKVSGDDNGFSFNTAVDANFSFYENTLDINTQIISPIASNAFNYYTYTLEGTFYEAGSLINKITVTPRRLNDRVFSGTLYIVEDAWQLYGVDLNTNGAAIQVPFIESINFKQNYKYENTLKQWVKISQVIDFSFSFLGLKGDGRFTAAYSEYNFTPNFDKKSFSNEILSFKKEANKKDTTFWNSVRPVALTDVERDDYIRKDSIQVLRKSKSYLDSLDRRANKFKLTSPVLGYRYTNTYDRWSFNVPGPLQAVQFSTVQGWNSTLVVSYNSWNDDDATKTFSAFAKANYGFSEDRLRYVGRLTRRFNRTNRATLRLSGGVDAMQINNSNPIRPIINSYLTLTQEKNFAKYYEKAFAEVYYGQEIINGFRLDVQMSFEKRNPLFNTTDQTFFPVDDRMYTSNNPLQPLVYGSAPFETHTIGKLSISGTINFGQKYYSYPSGKFNVNVDTYPSLSLVYEKGFGASVDRYDFDQLRLIIKQEFNIKNKGRLSYDARVGTFLGTGEEVSFIDRQHFNGNQSIFFDPSSLNRFYVLPYYERSTNKGYFEGHIEHNFRGWILGKIPLLNKLNWNLVTSAHVLSTQGDNFYREFGIGVSNVGFGKFRLLRFDYVYGQGARGGNESAFLIGLSL